MNDTEFDSELDALEFEDAFEEGAELDGEAESPFTEAEEMELAAGLLEVTDEAELDQFLGSLLKRAGRTLGQVVRSPVGQALGGLLKGAARKALPMAGRALGTYFGGPAGGAIGGQLASRAGQLFGLELEGLSDEDQEFEVARRFVRFAGAAANQAVAAPPSAAPQDTARAAVQAAAKQHAPGLLKARDTVAGVAASGRGRTGRWIRRGRKIIIYL
jgi:hypothetical protein